MSKTLIVDDSDPAITYTGNWASIPIVAVLTWEYNTSTHQSRATGDQLSYTFEGTGITVYGTLEAPSLNGSPAATFSIDGQTPTAFNATGDVLVDFPSVVTAYVPLYHSSGLAKGQHTLTVLSGTPPNASAHLNIDFLTVATGSDVASGNIIVDDRDDAIQYTGNWADVGTRWEYGLTSKGSPDSVPGGTATFRFNGTSITVYGTMTPSNGPNNTAEISFAIDGGFASMFNVPQNYFFTQHYPMYQVKGLPSTQEHTVVIKSLNTNRWFLDCIVYTTQNSSVAGGGGGGSGGGSVGGPDIGGGGGGTNVGAVTGGVIGGIFAGLAIAAIIFLLLRQREQKRGEKVRSEKQKVGTGSNRDASFAPFTPELTGAYAPASPLLNKRFDSNGNGTTPELTGGASAGRSGHARPDSTPSTSYLGTQSPLSTAPPAMSQYSDGESHHIMSAAAPVGPGHGNARQNLHSQLYPRFDPGSGGGVSAMYQRGSRQDYDQAPGHFSAPKALYSHGLPIAPPTPVVNRPPPSTVPTVEEDSGIRIPARSPPVYTPD